MIHKRDDNDSIKYKVHQRDSMMKNVKIMRLDTIPYNMSPAEEDAQEEL